MSNGSIERDKVVVRATKLVLVFHYDISQPVWRICSQDIKNVATHMCWGCWRFREKKISQISLAKGCWADREAQQMSGVLKSPVIIIS